MQTKIIKIKQVIERTSLSRSAIFAMAARGQFPKQIKLAERSAGWIEAEVEQWLSERINQRQIQGGEK